MKHKTIQQLRDTLNKVLKRGRPKQLKKLQKAYHGKRLKMCWASYAQFENLKISELKEMEGVGNRMKGGHTHNHVKNAHKRMKHCVICDKPITKYEGFSSRFTGHICMECYIEERREHAVMAGNSSLTARR